MANQVSEDEYRAQADRVIDNNETVEEIRTQIKSYIHDPAEKRGSAIVTIKNILEEE
jgi:dephospho-CoA kinase